MPNTSPPPPLTRLPDLQAQMSASGFAVLDARSVAAWAGWPGLPQSWGRH